jgi:hypothetical protein
VDLETLLKPVSVSTFLDQYFGQRFLRVPGTPEKFSMLARRPGRPNDELELSVLAQELEHALEAPIRVHAPGPGSGGLHRCERDGILLQISEQRDCKVYAGVKKLDGNPPVWEGLLTAGDALYIPRGWWLTTEPGGLEARFDIENPTGRDLLAWMFEYATRDEAFQSDIPRFADPARKADYVTNLRKTLARIFRAPALLEGFRRDMNFKAPPQPGLRIPWKDDTPDDHLIAILSPRRLRIKRASDETIVLVAMGKRLSFPEEAAPLLHYLSDRTPVSAAEFFRTFEADFGRAELSDLLSVLSKEGLIGVRSALPI